MFDVNVQAYSSEGDDLSFSQVCTQEEVNELKKCYDSEDLIIREIPNARFSQSMETCFCPYCMNMKFFKENNKVEVCSECGRKYFINL